MAARTIKAGLLRREFSVNRAAIDTKARTVELSFSSEEPVQRWFGTEILDHAAGSVDLSRLNGRAPLLMDHDTRDMVGVVESASVRNKRGYATVRFGNSGRAQEIFQDVQDGIRSLVSVGYRVNKMEEDVDAEEFRATSWMPMEISLVSIPADSTVGVGRSQPGRGKDQSLVTSAATSGGRKDQSLVTSAATTGEVDGEQWEITVEQTNKEKTENRNMKDGDKVGDKVADKVETPVAVLDANLRSDVSEMEARDAREIDAIVRAVGGDKKVPGIEALAIRAKTMGMTKQEFREEAQKLLPEPKPIQTAQSQPLGLKPEELKRYSLTRAINAIANRRELDGFEAELSREIEIKQKATPSGFWVPMDVLAGNMTRSFVAGTGTLGGMLVQTTNEASSFIELLRNKAQVMALGARVLLLDNPVTIPRQNAAGSSNWTGETVASTLSVGNFTNITLTPNGITANQQYSKQLLATNNPSIDNLVRDDILNVIALAIDLAALHGTGSGQPTGIANTTGIGSVALATNAQALGNSTAYPAMVSLETLVSAANADMGALAYLMRSAHRGSLRIAQRFSSTDSPVWTNQVTGPGVIPGNGANDGVVNGYRAGVTNQIATNLTTGTATTICSMIFFGNWNELLIGQFNAGATDLIVDPYTAGANGVVRLYARHWIDIGVRHPGSFAALGGIL